MIDRTPTRRAERPALPAFDAVPSTTPRHDGWPPARQVPFIEAIADTGSLKSDAAQVNMSSESAYALRRAPGTAGFARAWKAALARKRRLQAFLASGAPVDDWTE